MLKIIRRTNRSSNFRVKEKPVFEVDGIELSNELKMNFARLSLEHSSVSRKTGSVFFYEIGILKPEECGERHF